MKIVKCGVLQGSILGPLLFLVFVNDLSNSTKVLDPVPFADETKLFCSDDKIRTQELNQINHWFLANKLSLNVGKQNICYFIKLQIKITFPFIKGIVRSFQEKNGKKCNLSSIKLFISVSTS